MPSGTGQSSPSGGPRVCVIVPSWSGNVQRVLDSVSAQTMTDVQVEVVTGVSPAARARNLGARRTAADIMVFIDDDAYLGSDTALVTLVEALGRNPAAAVVGTSKLIPLNASRLQKAIAAQVPRMTYPVVPRDLESNPPRDRYGFSAVTTTCCAVRRHVFEALGGFDEGLRTGEDTEFFYRVHELGYGIVVAGESWVYHDPPRSLRELLRKSFGYGMGHAFEARKTRGRGMALLQLDRWYYKIGLLGAAAAFPFAFFIHPYFEPERHVEFGFRPLKTLSTYAVLCGYAYGWSRAPQSTTTAHLAAS